jgi:transposase
MDTNVLIKNKTEVSLMEKIPQGRYTREFREEAARLVIEDGMSAGEVSARLSLPKSTLENWVRAAKAGKLGAIGKNRKPLTEVEVELARVKRELAITRMERDILKKAAAYFAKESLHGTR